MPYMCDNMAFRELAAADINVQSSMLISCVLVRMICIYHILYYVVTMPCTLQGDGQLTQV